MEYSFEHHDSSLNFNIKGRLTFSDNATFLEVARMLDNGHLQHLNVGLDYLDYIDSSGIGMLLVLKDKCNEKGATMVLRNPAGQVEKILNIASINKVIDIEH